MAGLCEVEFSGIRYMWNMKSLRASSISFQLLDQPDLNLQVIARNAGTSVQMIDQFYAKRLTAEMHKESLSKLPADASRRLNEAQAKKQLKRLQEEMRKSSSNCETPTFQEFSSVQPLPSSSFRSSSASWSANAWVKNRRPRYQPPSLKSSKRLTVRPHPEARNPSVCRSSAWTRPVPCSRRAVRRGRSCPQEVVVGHRTWSLADSHDTSNRLAQLGQGSAYFRRGQFRRSTRCWTRCWSSPPRSL